MLDWLYQLPVVSMTWVLYLATLAVSGIIHACIQRCAKGEWARAFQAISPVMLTPLAVVFGLLVGFLTNQVWSDARQANAAVAQEASALRTLVVLAASFPGESEQRLRELVRSHVRDAVDHEWPAMAAHHASWPMLANTDGEALATILGLVPISSAQEIAQQSLFKAVQRAQDARRLRIIISQSTINGLKWSVLAVLAVLILITIALVHSANPRASVISLTLFSAGVAACLVLIAAHNHPFSGEISVGPELLQQVLPAS